MILTMDLTMPEPSALLFLLQILPSGSMIGGILPLFLIPFLERYIVKSEAHIMVGDHEDIERDLKDKKHKHNH